MHYIPCLKTLIRQAVKFFLKTLDMYLNKKKEQSGSVVLR